ncbi:hypothetical protein HDU78_009357 [Chytriomyces hyalinus]|nr:hypothetical protein HDU78_009357 [Chytriomyces hyalinus]
MEQKVIELTDLVEQLTSELQMQMRSNIDGVEPDIGVTSQAEDSSLAQKIVPSSAATTHDNNNNNDAVKNGHNPSELLDLDEASTIQLLKQTIAELECENESLRHVAFAFDLKPLSSTPHVPNVHFVPGSAAWGDHALHFTKPAKRKNPSMSATNQIRHLITATIALALSATAATAAPISNAGEAPPATVTPVLVPLVAVVLVAGAVSALRRRHTNSNKGKPQQFVPPVMGSHAGVESTVHVFGSTVEELYQQVVTATATPPATTSTSTSH